MIKVLGISCTPRKGGNTDILVGEAIKGAKEAGANTELLCIREKMIQPCQGCITYCREHFKCHLNDDMPQIYEKLISVDGIIIGAPMYWTMCGLGVNFLDRLLPLAYSAQLTNKVGGAIAVGARIGVDHVLALFRRFFMFNHMFSTECVAGYAAESGAVIKDEFAMKASWELGREVALFAAQKNKFPEEFSKYFTNVVYGKYGVARYPKP